MADVVALDRPLALDSAIDDPAWTLTLPRDGLLERAHESLFTVADGRFGTRGSPEEDGPTTTSTVLAAGVYEARGALEHLLEGPLWTRLGLDGPVGDDRCSLDLARGIVVREGDVAGAPLRIERFSSLARPGVMVLRADGPTDAMDPGPPLVPPLGAVEVDQGVDGDTAWMTIASDLGGAITAVAHQHVEHADGRTRVERIAVYAAMADAHPERAAVQAGLDDARGTGVATLRQEHADAWQRRWDDADIVIEDDAELQPLVRFALFHLMSSVATVGEAAVGARGLSGPAYAGHVFWDADIYALPFLAATRPEAARAMLAYRVARLDAAQDEAAHHHLRGAQFPWESASSGHDVTPRVAHHDDGSVHPIETGDHAEHITADVAWAATEYLAWSGDDGFAATDGRRLLAETARFWASRTRSGPDGAHLDGVVGPDEYRGVVDDNAYTNVMARANLRHAAIGEQRDGGAAEEAAQWARLADALVDGYDPSTGLYEQCVGFFDLESVLIGDLADPPVAADLLLGADRVRSAQIVKQPDVLMLHHLVPTEVEVGSLVPNLDFYLPRTAHGSSLSPPICASLLARAGRPDEGLALLRMACRLDVDDLTDTTAGGLHLATMGGVWQAIVYGFAGVRAGADGLLIDPQLPTSWTRLEVRLQFRGQRLRLALGHGEIRVSCAGAIDVVLADGTTAQVDEAGARFVMEGGRWERGTS